MDIIKVFVSIIIVILVLLVIWINTPRMRVLIKEKEGISYLLFGISIGLILILFVLSYERGRIEELYKQKIMEVETKDTPRT